MSLSEVDQQCETYHLRGMARLFLDSHSRRATHETKGGSTARIIQKQITLEADTPIHFKKCSVTNKCTPEWTHPPRGRKRQRRTDAWPQWLRTRQQSCTNMFSNGVPKSYFCRVLARLGLVHAFLGLVLVD